MRHSSAALAVLALMPVAPARADVRITADRVVVTAGSARATVERSPYRLTFADGDRVVLEGLADAGQAPLTVAPQPDTQPGGLRPSSTPALYAPLGFLVGERATTQHPVFQWEGDYLTGVEGGTIYSAREVVAARDEGGGARLGLSTSDPSGRRLVVTIAPERPGALRVSVRPTPSDGVAVAYDSFASPAAEAFRGFGGRHNALDQRGNELFNWLNQESLGAGFLEPVSSPAPGSGGERYLFPTGPDAAYYVQSLFHSSRGYGFLLDRSELSRWRMASDRDDAWQVAVASPALDYVVAPADSLRTLTAISGRHDVPPEWALGPAFDRLVKATPQGPEAYEAEVRDDIARIDRYGLPVTAYRIEAWQWLPRETLEELIAMLRARGIHPMLYFRAFVGQDEIGTDSPAAYDEAVSKGYVATTASGEPFLFVSNFQSLGAQIDFTKPEAVQWWKGRIREALDLGADGFMQDFGEQVLVEMHFANGETGASMHNRLPNLMHRATREVFDAYRREHPERELFFFTRAGHTGTPGAAAYEYANFPGDATTDWSSSSGLRSLATDMLNRAVGGLYGFNADIGGFFDVGPYTATTKELFIRWAQWSVFTPVFRLHGSVGAGTHAPWTYDDETVRIYDRLSRLHMRARPLILRLWREAVRTGMPPTRPLWLAYPGERDAAAQDQEWLLGPDLLVAPVVHEGASGRDIWFPPGCWRHPETGHQVTGPGSQAVAAGLETLPYYYRCGTDPLAAPLRPRLKLAARCLRGRRLRMRVTGPGRSLVRRVDFRAGRHRARDRRAPFVRVVRRARVLRATAVLRDGRRIRLRAKRVGCRRQA